MKNKSKIIKFFLGTLILVAVVSVMLLVYYKTKQKPSDEGGKKITVQVIIPEEKTTEYKITTDATSLREALDEEKLIEGSGSDDTFFITGVNGRTADSSKEEWWCITKGGEEVFTGVNSIMIYNGDQYELTLMTGW